MTHESGSRPGRALALACWIVLAGCSKERHSQPTAPPPPTRAVGTTAEDTTGARVAGVVVRAVRLDDVESDVKITDAAGEVHFDLHDGRWCLSAGREPAVGQVDVAGSTGNVAQKPAGTPDSLLFRLVL